MYGFEDASFPFSGGECRCGFDDPGEQEEPPPDSPSFSAGFSRSAVIYEDAYENRPGNWKPRRSTRVLVSVAASGGPNGGSFTLSTANLGKLSPVACGPMVLPPSMTLGPYEGYYASFICEGAAASGSADDVSISGMFIENETGEQISADDSLTVVRVELTPWLTIEENPSPHRHLLGVGESVNCSQYPNFSSVTWRSDLKWPVSSSSGQIFFTCPFLAGKNGISVTCGGLTYKPQVNVIEPDGIVAINVTSTRYGVPKGEAGGIGMELDLYLTPRNVSFGNIAMQETPCLTGTHSGYFDNPEFSNEWSHTEGQGAGEWYDVGTDNFFFRDNPRIERSLPRMTDDGRITTNKTYGWIDGTMVWDIPLGWGPKGTRAASGQVGSLEGYRQTFVIFSDGLAGVRKFSNQVTRRTNDVVYLNGVLRP